MPELPRSLPLSDDSRLAIGAEKTVHIDGVDRVVKVYRGNHKDKSAAVVPDRPYNQQRWKRLLAQEFYVTKIVCLLFPHTVADIHMASVASDIAPQSVHEKISPATDVLSRLRDIYAFFADVQRDSDKARDIADAYWDAGVTLQFTKDNFTYDEQRRLQYVDSLAIRDIDLLQQAIRERLSGDEQKKAQRYLDRLRHHLSV